MIPVVVYQVTCKCLDTFTFLTLYFTEQLIYEGFKTKQVYASLIEQKQILTNRLKQINTLGDCYKQRAARLEEHVYPKATLIHSSIIRFLHVVVLFLIYSQSYRCEYIQNRSARLWMRIGSISMPWSKQNGSL